MYKNEQKIEVSDCHQRECIFKRVPASELSLKDDFLKFTPKTEREKTFMEDVKRVIEVGVRDFWCPTIDPSFDDDGHICYKPGNMPAVGESFDWWAKTAKEFKPERGSRLGTKSEYVTFLAVLIKKLVASGKSVEWAWNAMCNNSRELGHYRNSKDAKHDFEPTGSREICGMCDLANAYKILAEDEEAGGCWFGGGTWFLSGNVDPLAGVYHVHHRKGINNLSCGWLVFDSCPEC